MPSWCGARSGLLPVLLELSDQATHPVARRRWPPGHRWMTGAQCAPGEDAAARTPGHKEAHPGKAPKIHPGEPPLRLEPANPWVSRTPAPSRPECRNPRGTARQRSTSAARTNGGSARGYQESHAAADPAVAGPGRWPGPDVYTSLALDVNLRYCRESRVRASTEGKVTPAGWHHRR